MKIDEEIKSSFDNEYHRAVVNLLYTHSFLTNKINDTMKKYRLTRQQYNVLRILRGQHPNPASVLLIKERMLEKMSDASRIIDRLLKKGLIDKKVSQSDRRSVDIKISNEGLELLKEMDPYVMENNLVLEKLSTNEAISLSHLLDKIRS